MPNFGKVETMRLAVRRIKQIWNVQVDVGFVVCVFFCVDDYFFKLFCDCIFLESPEIHFWFLFLDEYKSREPNLFIFFCSVYFSVFLSCWIKHVKAVRNKNNGKRIPNQASLLECFSIMRGCISVWLLLFYRRDRNAFPL